MLAFWAVHDLPSDALGPVVCFQLDTFRLALARAIYQPLASDRLYASEWCHMLLSPSNFCVSPGLMPIALSPFIPHSPTSTPLPHHPTTQPPPFWPDSVFGDSLRAVASATEGCVRRVSLSAHIMLQALKALIGEDVVLVGSAVPGSAAPGPVDAPPVLPPPVVARVACELGTSDAAHLGAHPLGSVIVPLPRESRLNRWEGGCG